MQEKLDGADKNGCVFPPLGLAFISATKLHHIDYLPFSASRSELKLKMRASTTSSKYTENIKDRPDQSNPPY